LRVVAGVVESLYLPPPKEAGSAFGLNTNSDSKSSGPAIAVGPTESLQIEDSEDSEDSEDIEDSEDSEDALSSSRELPAPARYQSAGT
jgi:hypothetical protein